MHLNLAANTHVHQIFTYSSSFLYKYIICCSKELEKIVYPFKRVPKNLNNRRLSQTNKHIYKRKNTLKSHELLVVVTVEVYIRATLYASTMQPYYSHHICVVVVFVCCTLFCYMLRLFLFNITKQKNKNTTVLAMQR